MTPHDIFDFGRSIRVVCSSSDKSVASTSRAEFATPYGLIVDVMLALVNTIFVVHADCLSAVSASADHGHDGAHLARSVVATFAALEVERAQTFNAL